MFYPASNNSTIWYNIIYKYVAFEPMVLSLKMVNNGMEDTLLTVVFQPQSLKDDIQTISNRKQLYGLLEYYITIYVIWFEISSWILFCLAGLAWMSLGVELFPIQNNHVTWFYVLLHLNKRNVVLTDWMWGIN